MLRREFGIGQWAMPERKRFFLIEAFPNVQASCIKIIAIMQYFHVQSSEMLPGYMFQRLIMFCSLEQIKSYFTEVLDDP